MRRIEIYKDGDELVRRKVIESPWLRQEEAAAYCSMSRSAFRDRATRLPHGGDESIKLYHETILDAFIEGRLPDAPFDGSMPEKKGKRTKRQSVPAMGIVDPGTGRLHTPKDRRE